MTIRLAERPPAVALVTHRLFPGKVSIIETANHRVLQTIDISGAAPVAVGVTPDGDRAYVACESSGILVQLESERRAAADGRTRAGF